MTQEKSQVSVAEPQNASAIMLLRKIPDKRDFEIFMVQKHPDLKFAGGTYVFPGGRVETADYDPRMEKLCASLTFQKARAILRETSDLSRPFHKGRDLSTCLGYWVAAIRELFEEAGILLAYDKKNRIPEVLDRFLSYRKRMQQMQISMLDMALEEDLTLATDLLFYFSHWITPEVSPIRYSTRFFVAELPTGQVTSHDDGETIASVWITPKEAMERYKEGRLPIMFPVFHNLKSLSEFSTIKELIESTKGKEVKAILPRWIEQNGKKMLVLPEDSSSASTLGK